MSSVGYDEFRRPGEPWGEPVILGVGCRACSSRSFEPTGFPQGLRTSLLLLLVSIKKEPKKKRQFLRASEP